jgi:hypothetical protein
LVCGGSSRLAPDPPCPSVLPPGAGNEEPKKAVKTDEQRAKKGEERTVLETGVVQRHLHTATIRPDDDGDVPSISAMKQAQFDLPNDDPAIRVVRAVYEAFRDRATSPAVGAGPSVRRRLPDKGERPRPPVTRQPRPPLVPPANGHDP